MGKFGIGIEWENLVLVISSNTVELCLVTGQLLALLHSILHYHTLRYQPGHRCNCRKQERDMFHLLIFILEALLTLHKIFAGPSHSLS